jgi:hypothetical protein
MVAYMLEFALRVLLLLRLLCFMALVYLVLHGLFVRLITRPDSKILWFFSVVTAPLICPVRLWLAPGTPDSRLLRVALLVYGMLWGLIIVVTHLLTGVVS